MSGFDGVIIGGGHNGLVAAAYLARAGLRVAVVERNAHAGGGCMTDEVTHPGFRHNMHANFHVGFYRMPPYRDLELHRYGLAYVLPPVQHGVAFRDGSALTIHRDVEATARSIARFSEKDARTYRELTEKYRALIDFVVALRYAPPRPPPMMAQFVPPQLMGEVATYFGMSGYQAVDAHFENERTRIFFKMLFHANLLEDLPGTGIYFPLVFALLTEVGLPVGGTVNMALALERAIRAHGGAVLTGRHVKRIVVANGRAAGVELESGETIDASKFVASAIDAPQTVRLAGEQNFPSDVVDKMRKWKYVTHAHATVHVALSEPPRFRAAAYDPDLDRAFNFGFGADTTDELKQATADAEAGRIPSRIVGNGSCNTIHDPTYAPAGNHLAFFGAIVPPADRDGPGPWADARDFGERMLATWRDYAPNLDGKNVSKHYFYSPHAMATQLINMVQGGHHMGAYNFDQIGPNRPHLSMGAYRTPVGALYLCGSSSHPGGAITGAPGYNAANAIADDLGAAKTWTPVK